MPVDDSDGGSSEVSFDGNAPTSAGIAQYSDHPSQPPPSSQSRVTREDLNAAIEAGDWAVVGATAALLADSNVSDQSLSGSEHGLQPQGSFFSEGSDSNHRAAELDRMVEHGDWAGVVAAAAQIQGTSSYDGREDESTQYSSNSKSGSPSSREKEEIRAEVERLVRRVVPDEIDNIDEMMLQFEVSESTYLFDNGPSERVTNRPTTILLTINRVEKKSSLKPYGQCKSEVWPNEREQQCKRQPSSKPSQELLYHHQTNLQRDLFPRPVSHRTTLEVLARV